MIQSYKDRRVKKLHEGEDIREWAAIRRQAEKRLRILDAADRIETLMLLPSNRFEALHGRRNGQYSIRINDLLGKSLPRNRRRRAFARR